MTKYISGFLTGLIFGYILKRSRFCMAGLIRDIFLEKSRGNILQILAIISAEGLLIQLFVAVGIVHPAQHLPPFSAAAVGIGSFLFGFGAVMANGCLTSTLVKCGDGRVVGFVSLTVFMISAYVVSAGPAIGVSKLLRRTLVLQDDLPFRTSSAALLLYLLLSAALFGVLIKMSRSGKPRFQFPGQYTGIRHILFEKRWTAAFVCGAVGGILGAAFPISEMSGRPYGIAIAAPVMSFVYTFAKPAEITGGCNSYDQVFGWGAMMVIGLVAGVFLTSLIGGEFAVVKPDRKTLAHSVIGSILMGVGSMWGLGCLVSNGLVGTAQMSVKSWYALLFITLGIFAGTKCLYGKRSVE